MLVGQCDSQGEATRVLAVQFPVFEFAFVSVGGYHGIPATQCAYFSEATRVGENDRIPQIVSVTQIEAFMDEIRRERCNTVVEIRCENSRGGGGGYSYYFWVGCAARS